MSIVNKQTFEYLEQFKEQLNDWRKTETDRLQSKNLKERLRGKAALEMLQKMDEIFRTDIHNYHYPQCASDTSKEPEDMTYDEKETAKKWIRTLTTEELGSMLCNCPGLPTA